MIPQAHFPIPRALLPTSKRITTLFQLCSIIPVSDNSFVTNCIVQWKPYSLRIRRLGLLTDQLRNLQEGPHISRVSLMILQVTRKNNQFLCALKQNKETEYPMTCLLAKEHKTISKGLDTRMYDLFIVKVAK